MVLGRWWVVLGFLWTWHFKLRPNSSILVSWGQRILFVTVWVSHSGSLELIQSDLSYQGPFPPNSQFGRVASSRKSPGCSKLLPFKNYGGHRALEGLQCSRKVVIAFPDLCIYTVLSLSSADNSFNLIAWFLLWYALSAMRPLYRQMGAFPNN